jgi:ABC-type sugar transport system substrate-binding protein
MEDYTMRKLLVLVLTLCMILSLAACAQPAEEPEVNEPAAPEEPAATEAPAEEPATPEEPSADLPLAGKVIGNTIVYKGDVWCALLAEEFEKQAAALGAEITVEDGDLNAETQNKQIENMISRKVDVIFADPATLDGCTAAFVKAYDAGIPIFTYDSEPSYENVISHTGWDNYETGRMVGEYVVNYINENLGGEAKIVLLGNYASEHCMHREEEFMKVIEATNGKVQVISRQDSEGNREKGANAITNIVEPFDIVVSVVDNGAWGAVSALEARGETDIKVFCMGAYGDEPFQALRDSHPIYEACLIVDPAAIARITLDNYVKYVQGQTEFEKVTNIPLYICNTENIKDFYSFPNG